MAEQQPFQIEEAPMLCRVCGDKACGLHYGVHSCERCRIFFKRTITHNIQNKPCKNNQQCSILWHNRKRCYSCYVKKCIAVGMSKDAPQYGRVLKREKANILTPMKVKIRNNEMQKIIAAMQKLRISKCKNYEITTSMKKSNVLKHKKFKISPSIKKVTILNDKQNANVPKLKKPKILASVQNKKTDFPNENLCAKVEEDFKLIASIKKAHEDTCDLTKEKVTALFEKAHTKHSYSFSQLVCPLNTTPYPTNKCAASNKMELFEQSTTIQSVIEFAKRIPCFKSLPQWDQDVLLKAGVFEVLLVRLAYLFNSQDNCLLCFNGLYLQRDLVEANRDAGFLFKSIFDLAERMNNLHLYDEEVAVFCSILLIAADHPGLKNTGQVLRLQNKLMDILKRLVFSNHLENPNFFSLLMKMIPDIRIINCLHSKKLIAYEMESGKKNLPGTVGEMIEMITNVTDQKDNSSTHLDHLSQSNLPISHSPFSPPEEMNNSPGQQRNSSGNSTINYEWSIVDSIRDKELSSPSMRMGDSNNSPHISSSSSSGSYLHDDPRPSGTLQTVNLVHEVNLKWSAKAGESDNEDISAGGGYFFDSTIKPSTSDSDSGFES